MQSEHTSLECLDTKILYNFCFSDVNAEKDMTWI